MFLEILGQTFFSNTFFETRAYCSHPCSSPSGKDDSRTPPGRICHLKHFLLESACTGRKPAMQQVVNASCVVAGHSIYLPSLHRTSPPNTLPFNLCNVGIIINKAAAAKAIWQTNAIMPLPCSACQLLLSLWPSIDPKHFLRSSADRLTAEMIRLTLTDLEWSALLCQTVAALRSPR